MWLQGRTQQCTFISLCCGLNFHSIPALVSALNLGRREGVLVLKDKEAASHKVKGLL